MKHILPIAGCALGGGLIGFFVGKLDIPLGIVFFAVSVFLLTVCSYVAAKGAKKASPPPRQSKRNMLFARRIKIG